MYDRLREVRRQRAGEERGSKKCIYYCYNDADGRTKPASYVKLNDAEKNSVNLKDKERIRISISSLVSAMIDADPFSEAENYFPADKIDIVLATDIPELFADMESDGDFTLVEIPPNDKTVPNWQYIGRWLNLNVLENYDRVLYVDSDTIWHDDPQLLFDKYNVAEVYGREELGFPMDTNTGAYGENGRYLLDMVDAGIVSEWPENLSATFSSGTIPPKYCMGVMLFNNRFHNYIYSKIDYLKSCIQKCIDGNQFYPLPNLRIVDEYAMWCLLGQINNFSYDYFSPQDVSMPYGEKKHADYYNPVLLHYCTNKEKEAVKNMPELEELKKYMNDEITEVPELFAEMEETVIHENYTGTLYHQPGVEKSSIKLKRYLNNEES